MQITKTCLLHDQAEHGHVPSHNLQSVYIWLEPLCVKQQMMLILVYRMRAVCNACVHICLLRSQQQHCVLPTGVQ